MMEFNIGDRVRSLTFDKEGVVEDKLFSKKTESWVYTVHFDDSQYPFATPFSGEDLDFVFDDTSYVWEMFMADNNVVTAVMYEVIDGEKHEIARNHGHIIHSGVIGVAQAASFAMKKIYIGMNDGKLIGWEGN